MSKVKIQGNASGTGVVTLTAPNTNTDRTITLPDGTQTLIGADASGNVTVSTGNLVIGTSGKGIDFSADGNAAGMTSEVLDDYDTGTIDISTMSFLTSGSLTTNTNYQLLSYTKIGNLVTVIGNIYVNTVTAQSGALKIPLPFTNGTGQEHRTAGIIKHYQEQTAETFVRIDPNTAYGLVLKAPSWGASTIANGDTLIVNLTYTV